MIYPNENNNQALYAGSEKDILLEVDLNGKIRFDVLLFAIYNQLNIPYKIINADLEYINGNNFGNVHLQLKVNSSSVTELDDYLKKYKLVNSKIDVIQKRIRLTTEADFFLVIIEGFRIFISDNQTVVYEF